MDKIFYELHRDLPREGPGSDEATRRVFEMLPQNFSNPLILDIGCGPGMQTMELSRRCDGEIIAIDNHQPFLDQLNHKLRKKRLTHRITTVNGSLFEMNFKRKSFDIIWAEGVIYLIGFERGLREWKGFLKEQGFLVVSEISWLKKEIPENLREFWTEAYPGIGGIHENLRVVEECGYHIVGLYILPERDWWDNYYDPLEKRINKLRNKYKNDEEALKVIDIELYEIELFRKYSSYYGYVFYLMQQR